MPRMLRLLGCAIGSALLSCTAVVAQTDNSRTNEVAHHVNQGVRLMRARQYQGAMSEFEAAKAIDPKNPIVKANIAECFNNMGINMYRQRQYSDAIIQFEHCLELLPQHAQARHNIGLCRQRMEIEGIPDTPSDDDSKPDKDKKAKKDSESDSDKKEESSAKIGGGGGAEMTVSAGGTKIYTNGSKIFPNYSENPTAASGGVLPWMKTSTPGSTVGTAGSISTQTTVSVPYGPVHNGANNAATLNKSIFPAPGQAPAALPATPVSSTPANTATGLANTATGPANTATGLANTATGPANIAPPANPGTPATGGDAFDTQATPAVPAVPSAPTTSSDNHTAPNSASQSPDAATATNSAITTSATPTAASSNPSFGSQAISPSNYTPASDGMTLDDKVSAIELKVYGKKNTGLPMMQRIEQLETDYVGQKRSGPMNERVEYLKKAIGQN